MKTVIFIVIFLLLLFILSILITRFIRTKKIKVNKCKCTDKTSILSTLGEYSGYPVNNRQNLNLYSFPDIPLEGEQSNEIVSEEEIVTRKIDYLQHSINKYVDNEKGAAVLFNVNNIELTSYFPKDIIDSELKKNITWLILQCLVFINAKINTCFGNIEINHITIEKDNENHFRIKNDIFIYDLKKNYGIRIILTVVLHKLEIWIQSINLWNKPHSLDKQHSLDLPGIAELNYVENVPHSNSYVIKTNNNYNRWIVPDIPDTLISPTCCNEIPQWDSFGIATNPVNSRRCSRNKVSEIKDKWPDYSIRYSNIYQYLFSVARGMPGIPTGISNK